MSDGLRIPMSEDLVWAKVTRPRTPLVYLDLFAIVRMARARRGADADPAYLELYEAALKAKHEKRAMFPLSSEHVWELSKITDPKQRAALADIFESLSDFQYMLGRTTIAELEFEAGMAHLMGEDNDTLCLPLLRQTLGNAFGMVGGLKILDKHGEDSSEEVRATMGDAEYDELMAQMNYLMEHMLLRGPSDDDLVRIRKNPNYQPERAISGQLSRVAFELETKRILDKDPKWRRGRLRDVISAREFVHEWLDMFNRVHLDRIARGLPSFDTGDPKIRNLLASMPHSQVAISVKTRFHQNSNHDWKPNHVVDIDALSVAYAYCEAVFPDKEVRSALVTSRELRVLDTFVPRRPQELAAWLDALPEVIEPDMFVPHPLGQTAA